MIPIWVIILTFVVGTSAALIPAGIEVHDWLKRRREERYCAITNCSKRANGRHYFSGGWYPVCKDHQA